MFVVLNQHPTNGVEAFDPTRTGLDHVGFTMPDRATLERAAGPGYGSPPGNQ
ncbi:MAG: hypothetical protein QOC66_415 [Pseudonocardiales bacterium]|jgi:catechol-2,3-dioxygenase|nr:hypothetical protein [Pseudonocardiales bacterium]